MQFKEHQIGYAQINLPEKGYSITIDDRKSYISKASMVNVGPLIRGMHRFEIKDLIKGGVNINMAFIESADTLFIRPAFSQKEINPQIIIKTEPAEASVMIDGQNVTGIEPEKLNIVPGTHSIIISHPGYNSTQTFVHMQSGQNYNLCFVLKKQ